MTTSSFLVFHITTINRIPYMEYLRLKSKEMLADSVPFNLSVYSKSPLQTHRAFLPFLFLKFDHLKNDGSNPFAQTC